MTSYSSKIQALQDALVASPEYEAIIPLFVELIRYLESRAGQTGITVNRPQDGQKEHLAHGFPLLSPANLAIDRAVCSDFLSGAIAVFMRVGKDGADDLARIEQALREGRLDLEGLFCAILERRRDTIDDAARSAEVPAPLLEYIFEIPLKAALESFAGSISVAEVADWTEGFCPLCGSRAGMAELVGEEGKRFLMCSTCTFHWPFKRLQCPYCGNEEGGNLSYFLAGEGATRVDTCKACSRYIKTRDSRKGGAGLPLDVEDLLTIHLDLLAAKEGFERGK